MEIHANINTPRSVLCCFGLIDSGSCEVLTSSEPKRQKRLSICMYPLPLHHFRGFGVGCRCKYKDILIKMNLLRNIYFGIFLLKISKLFLEDSGSNPK